jgi:putative nucleotidyltransferase with HDIG domain
METTPPRSAVLFVDDEPNLLSALRRTMRGISDECSVAFATNATEALELIATTSFDIIVSDMRMPGIDGAELLNQIRRSNPETIRIVLSGQANLESTVRAIASTHQYLSKPMNFEQLRSLLHELHSSRALIPSSILRKHIARISAVPCQRAVLQAFQRACAAGTATREEIEAIARLDLGLSVTLLHVAISMNPSLATRITNVSQAVSYLSPESLQAISVAPDLCIETESIHNGFDLAQITEHSYRTAAIAKEFAVTDQQAAHPYAELVGLVHDIGKLVISDCFGELAQFTQLAQGEDAYGSIEDVDVQRQLLGITHAEAGAYLLKLRGFPGEVVEAVRLHHQAIAKTGPRLDLSEILYLANRAAHERG